MTPLRVLDFSLSLKVVWRYRPSLGAWGFIQSLCGGPLPPADITPQALQLTYLSRVFRDTTASNSLVLATALLTYRLLDNLLFNKLEASSRPHCCSLPRAQVPGDKRICSITILLIYDLSKRDKQDGRSLWGKSPRQYHSSHAREAACTRD